MLRYGIPAYRLPPDLLEQELDQIRVLGIPIHTGTPVGSLETFRKDYDAVFLGLGTQRARVIPIDGVQQSFVLGGDRLPARRAQRQADARRTAGRRHRRRQRGGRRRPDGAPAGRPPRRPWCRSRSGREMTASPHEIENAVGEGVQLHPGWGPVRIDEDGDDHLPVLRADARRGRAGSIRSSMRRGC